MSTTSTTSTTDETVAAALTGEDPDVGLYLTLAGRDAAGPMSADAELACDLAGDMFVLGQAAEYLLAVAMLVAHPDLAGSVASCARRARYGGDMPEHEARALVHDALESPLRDHERTLAEYRRILVAAAPNAAAPNAAAPPSAPGEAAFWLAEAEASERRQRNEYAALGGDMEHYDAMYGRPVGGVQ